MNEQIARITQMEAAMNRCAGVLEALEQALDAYASVQEDLKTLDAYYSSPLWRWDFDDDSAGRLPKDLRRGVLSEDGLWNLLTDSRRLRQRLDALPEKG